MKRILSLAFILVTFGLNSFSQDAIELTPTFGYHFGGKAYFYEGNLKIDDNQTYGLILSVPVDWNVRGEFAWSRSDSRASFYSNRIGYDNTQFDMASNYFLLSGMKHVGSDKAQAFGGLSVGAAWLDAKPSDISDVWRFSFSLAAGAKFYLSDLIGIRLQGRLLVPIYFQGGGLFCGIGTGGSGCGISVGGTSSIVQGDFSAGLIFQLSEL